MKHLRLSQFAASLGTILFSQVSYAAAFQFYELGTPIVGTAAVGQAAVASDASTSYFNPAGMALLDSSQVLLGPQIILPYTNFSKNSSNTIPGNNGGNAGLLSPAIGAYYVYNFSPTWKFGVSLTSPYGGALNYNDHWVGRYTVQQMTFYTINLNPAVSYQVNDWLALGGGFSIEYANLYQTLALPVTPTVDGQATLKLDNFSPGFNLGILLSPTNTTKVGVAYRSQIIHDLNGNADFLNISDTPNASTKMVMPANIIASITQKMTDQFTLLGELGWSNWSSMVDTIVTVDNYTAVTPDNWHDTYRVGLGGQYRVISPLLLKAGASYDSSPTSSSNRLPDLPMDRQIRLAVGMEYELIKAATLGLSYEYIDLGDASMDNTSSNGTLSGDYSRNFANVFQASLNVKC